MSRAVLFAVLLVAPSFDSRLPALAQDRQGPRANPDLPPRDEKGRISPEEFFKRYPSHKLVLATETLLPGSDFGVQRAGSRFQQSWMVAAEGERVGINHKSAPLPAAVLICRTAAGQREIRPDGGCD